jgi:hypothetical protein
VTPADLLEGLAAELGAIDLLTTRGRAAWDAEELLRLAIERRWITAGNYAERYRLAAQLPPGTDPWAELYDYRCLSETPPSLSSFARRSVVEEDNFRR